MDGIGSKAVDGVEYLLFVVGALGAHLAWLIAQIVGFQVGKMMGS